MPTVVCAAPARPPADMQASAQFSASAHVRSRPKRGRTALFAAPAVIAPRRGGAALCAAARRGAWAARPAARAAPGRRRVRGGVRTAASAVAGGGGAGGAGSGAGGHRPGPVLAFLSTLVGVLVLIGSVLYKVPQVVRILRRRSARGISVLMYSLETLGQAFCFVYFARRAFPFATYGETFFIMVQNVLILALIVRYERLPVLPAAVLGALFAGALALAPVAPMRALVVLQVASIPLLNLAKIPQIALNVRRRSTGELSPATLGLQLLGNVARIFTTLAQVRDPLMLASTLVATVFNSTLFIQWIYYARAVPPPPVPVNTGPTS